MLSSPSKRRKLSPPLPTSISIPGTPSQIPGTRDAARTTPSRPSFASPTKASLSRHNPQLLEKHTLSGQGFERSPSKSNPVPFVAKESLFVTQSSDISVDENAVPAERAGSAPEMVIQRMPENEAQLLPASAIRSALSARGGLSAPPRRLSRTPGKRSSTIDEKSGATKARETAEAVDVEKPISPIPFRRTGLRRSPVQGSKTELKSGTQEEPDLPLTPTQRGLEDPVVTTPPSGIHSTPSKRKKTRVSKPKSSPLKSQLEAEPERPVKRRKEEPEVRVIQLPDPHAEKRRLRDDLLLELEQLKADILVGDQENERLRGHYRSGKGDPSGPPNPDEIRDLLLRATATAIAVPAKPPSIFQSLGAFLPFSAKPRPTSTADTSPLPSYLPLKLDNPLPYLEAFTDLQYTSVITLLPASTDESSAASDILTQHTINIRSPRGLFYSRLNMTVNTQSYSVAKLTIDVLDPNAEPELGSWARDRASGKGVLGRDVSAICWAMSQWHEAATKRARFWCALENELGNEEGLRQAVAKLRAVQKRKRKRDAEAEDAEADADGIADTEEEGRRGWSERTTVTRKQLQRHMKRTALTLHVRGVELTIKWDISFDWTGEAENNISASARMSSEWQGQDERGSFSRIPMVFEALVKKQGPMSATRAITTVLMGA